MKLSDKITWEFLSSLRTTTVLQVGYAGVIFVPAFSYLINTYNEFYPDFRVSLPKVVFWLYIGSLILAAAHFLNQTLCPYIIKRHGSLDEYRSNIAKLVTNKSVLLDANKIGLIKKFEAQIKSENKGFDDGSIYILAKALAETDKIRNIKEIINHESIATYKNEWNKANLSLKYLRVSILFLYAISGVIVSVIFLRQIYIVFKAAFPCGLPAFF